LTLSLTLHTVCSTGQHLAEGGKIKGSGLRQDHPQGGVWEYFMGDRISEGKPIRLIPEFKTIADFKHGNGKSNRSLE
jgi:hypothetical protein